MQFLLLFCLWLILPEVVSIHALFVGDSTMINIARFVGAFLGCSQAQESPRCNTTAYYGLEHVNRRWPPGACEGPVYYGLTQRQACMDCSGCASIRFHCNSTDELEFIGIEFAKDLEVQTALYETTQENIFHSYLQHRQLDFIFINTGLHDLAVCSTPDAFEQSLSFYMSVVAGRFPKSRLFWLSNTKLADGLTPGRFKNFTNADNAKLYNAISHRQSMVHGFKYVDLFRATSYPYFQRLHTDNIHLFQEDMLFYKMVAFHCLQLMVRGGS